MDHLLKKRKKRNNSTNGKAALNIKENLLQTEEFIVKYTKNITTEINDLCIMYGGN